MPLALASRRGALLNWRLAVNGIQNASRSSGPVAVEGAEVGAAAGFGSLCMESSRWVAGRARRIVKSRRSWPDPGFRIRKSECHNAKCKYAASPQNFSWWGNESHNMGCNTQVIE